jgi:hypothetical protein
LTEVGTIAALRKHRYVASNPCGRPKMKRSSKSRSGIQLLLKKYRAIFRIPENQNHYSKDDYRKAERKFLKYALEQRRIEIQDELFK